MKKIITNNNYTYKSVKPTNVQIKILYDLLKNRKFSISHEKIPSYKNHSLFVKKNPYKHWYIVYEDLSIVGAFYIKKDNSIGLNFKKQTTKIVSNTISIIKQNFLPTNPVPSNTPPFFYINVPFSNKKLQNILIKIKLSPMQVSHKF